MGDGKTRNVTKLEGSAQLLDDMYCTHSSDDHFVFMMTINEELYKKAEG